MNNSINNLQLKCGFLSDEQNANLENNPITPNYFHGTAEHILDAVLVSASQVLAAAHNYKTGKTEDYNILAKKLREGRMSKDLVTI